MDWFVRPSTLVAIARTTSYLFVLPDLPNPVLLDPLDVESMARLLARTAVPISREALEAVCDSTVIDMLVELGVLVRGNQAELAELAAPVRGSRDKRCKKVVVGLSGAVSVAVAMQHILPLADMFAETVEIIVTEGAGHFIEPRLYEYYGFRVWSNPFEPSHGVAVPHAYLATTTDLVLVAPASANTIHRLASGACSDLISLVVAATRAPVVVAPSTNEQMWLHPPVQRNVAQLRADGIWVVEPGLGRRVAERGRTQLGAGNFDVAGLIRALDVILGQAST